MGVGKVQGGKVKRLLATPKSSPSTKRTHQQTRGFLPLQVQQPKQDIPSTSKSPEQANAPVNNTPLNEVMDDGNDKDDSEVQLPSTSSAVKSKKVAPIVVAGSKVILIQNILNEVVASKKFQIRLTGVKIRIDLTEIDAFTNVQA